MSWRRTAHHHHRAMSAKNELLSMSASPIAYYAALSRASGSVTAGVMLSWLIQQVEDGDPLRWIPGAAAKLEEETGLTRREQETARRQLRERRFIEERLAGIPATLYYRVNLDVVAKVVRRTGND